MKKTTTPKLLTACAALLLLTPLSVWALETRSPDGEFDVKVGASVTLEDATGKTVLVLDRDTRGIRKIDLNWSDDSRKVVVVENAGRGSSVLAAWREGATWHKTLELDSDLAGVTARAQALRGGRLVSENRSAGQWISPNEVTIFGDMLFSSGAHAQYSYTLRFTTGPTRIDRGGYEEGAIKGVNYRHD
jgi:hypothetical protein